MRSRIVHRSAAIGLGVLAGTLSFTQTALAEPAAPPTKLKAAVLALEGSDEISTDILSSLTAILADTLEQLGAFDAISTDEIEKMLELEMLKNQLGCDDTQMCLAEIGGALGADYTVSGGLTLVGETYVVNLQLVNVKRARVDGRVSREYRGEKDGLTQEIRTATRILVRDILAERSGHLRVVASEEGASVRVNGSIVGVTPLEAPLDVAGGMHTVVVEKLGFVRFRKDVQIEQDREATVRAELRPSHDFIDAYRGRATTYRTLAWTGMAAGVAGIGLGIAAYTVGANQAADLRQQTRTYNQQTVRTPTELQDIRDGRSQVGTWDGVMLISSSLGVALLAAGLGLYFAGPDPDRYDISTEVPAGESKQTASELQWRLGPGTLHVSF